MWQIMIIGKSINFLYFECKESFQIPPHMASLSVAKQGIASFQRLIRKDFRYENMATIQLFIESMYAKISQDVLRILMDKYQLMNHLEALKKYLLLGQGDFIQYLMDSVGYT